jgi:hypothetical protein
VKLSGRAGHFTYRAGDLEQGGPERRVDQIHYVGFFAIIRLSEVNVGTDEVAQRHWQHNRAPWRHPRDSFGETDGLL